MPSNKPSKPQSNDSSHSKVSEFDRALYQSTQQIEMQVQIAQDAADLSRTHAARAKESAEQLRKFDPVALALTIIGICTLITASGLFIVRQNIIQTIQEQSHVQNRR